MIQVNNVQLKHNGIMADNSTKLTLYLPECTDEQHAEVIKLARLKTVAVLFMEPDKLEAIQELLGEMKNLQLLPEEDEFAPIKYKKPHSLPEDPLPIITDIMSKSFDEIVLDEYEEGKF